MRILSRSFLASALVLAACQTPSAGTTHPDMHVTEPQPNATISSPVTIKGEARGTWYFEASFPVRLLDTQGNEIAVVPAQAQGEWMTTDFVPFEVSVHFTTSATEGTLVLEKDNPSGLPENAASVTVPVRFKTQ